MATIKDAWPSLTPETRRRLLENSAETLPGDIAEEILNALGFTVSSSWFQDVHPSRIRLPSEQYEWIRGAAAQPELKAS
jgi:hypothetical protein